MGSDTEKPNGLRWETTNTIGIGFLGTGIDADGAAVDVNDGNLVRITPLHYAWRYVPQDFNARGFEARGKASEPA